MIFKDAHGTGKPARSTLACGIHRLAGIQTRSDKTSGKLRTPIFNLYWASQDRTRDEPHATLNRYESVAPSR
jgi:hypothetical protein